MTVNQIPLNPRAERFSIAMAGVTRILTLHFCEPMAQWCLDIADVDSTPVLSGLPLITGADLLGQYAYLELGGQLFVQSDDSADAPPTRDNLGSISRLYFVTP